MNKSELESLEAKGPETVLLEMAQGGHGSPDSQTRREVESWLRSKLASLTSKRDEREEITLSIAKQANLLASEANSIARIEAAAAARSARWAKYAAIIAGIAATAAIIVPLVIKK